MKPKQNKSKKKLYLAIFLILVILIILTAFVLMGKKTITGFTGFAVADSDVIEKLTELRPDLKDVQPVEIKKLAEPELSNLKQEQPVIYEGTNPGDYAIKYNDELVIYSYQNNKIINEFVLQTLTVS